MGILRALSVVVMVVFIHDFVSFDKDDLRQWVDLRPYMNPTPYLVFEKRYGVNNGIIFLFFSNLLPCVSLSSSSLSRIFRLFRTMGLRHLPIVNSHNQVGVGVPSVPGHPLDPRPRLSSSFSRVAGGHGDPQGSRQHHQRDAEGRFYFCLPHRHRQRQVPHARRL